MPGFALGLYTVSISTLVGALLGGLSYNTDAAYWLLLLTLGACFYKYKSMLSGFALICSWALMINWLTITEPRPEPVVKEIELQGVLVGLPVIGPYSTRFDLRISESSAEASVQTDDRVRLRWYQAPELKPGQRWQIRVRIKTPRNYANPGGFDYRYYLKRQGIERTGYIKRGILLGEEVGSLDSWRFGVRQQLIDQLGQERAAWVSALLLGDQSLLARTQWQWLSATGTTHLLVVSGMHMGLMAALGGFIGSMLFSLVACAGVGQRPWFVTAFALLFAAGYALISGFSVPAQRALLMLVLGLCAWLWGWRLDLRRLLPLVFILVLWIDPLVIGVPGLWLSFLAVASLLAALLFVQPRPNYARGLVRAQGAVLIGLAPVLLLLGYPLALLAPLINLIAIPLVTFIVLPGLFLTLAISLLGFGEVWLLWLLPLDLLAAVLAWLAGLDWQLFPRGDLWLAWGAGLLAALLWLWPGRPCWSAALGLWLLLLWPPQDLPQQGRVRIQMLDVGQGLSVLVQTRRHQLLFDTGERYGDFILGQAVVEPYLHRRQVASLDLLVISHPDRDHSGGAEYLIERFAPRQVLKGWGLNDSCHRHPPWNWDGVEFRFLPVSNLSGPDNGRSCVLLISAGDQSALLTGDIGHRRERQLMTQLAGSAELTLLQVAHHGSSGSTSEAFLAQHKPVYAWVSAGAGNRFGHPHPKVLERLQDAGARVWSTAEHGLLELELGHQAPPEVRAHISD